MKTRDQNLALALHMGYKLEWPDDMTLRVIRPDGTLADMQKCNGRTQEETINDCHYCFPNYTNSLDEISKVENNLGTLRLQEYGKQLQEVTCWHCVGVIPDYHRDLIHLAKVARATALQRAEALLRTLGLWLIPPKAH